MGSVYPRIAELAQVEGVVRIRMVVGTDGVPYDVQFLSGPPLLMGVAMNAVKTWRFRPMLVNGIPVEVETVTGVGFFPPGRDPSTLLALKRNKVQKHPNDPKAPEALARELFQDGDLTESADEFRKSIALKPNDAGLRFGLPDAMQENGDLQAAIGEYRRGFGLVPKAAKAREELARCLDEAGDSDAALSEYRLLLQQDRDDGNAHFSVGVSLMNKGDLDGAIKELRAALHDRFDTPTAHFLLGKALEEKTRFKEALKEYKRAASEAPQEKSYQEAKDRLERALQQQSREP